MVNEYLSQGLTTNSQNRILGLLVMNIFTAKGAAPVPTTPANAFATFTIGSLSGVFSTLQRSRGTGLQLQRATKLRSRPLNSSRNSSWQPSEANWLYEFETGSAHLTVVGTCSWSLSITKETLDTSPRKHAR